ncbi:4-diphosphocytidyl-2-C-methyl-D-erythritol kinase [Curvibacter sp. AEP1-3]|uniref:4-(cytidine 5'-diphospho)-2-C-methyl-D-erythritol kinase n=1 Tax=Curvibacter sp. AEP1-3 TaxID=1844971 RepID=UPI000B3CE3CB|nr:4-(cytidine 5'-diphospho)-2-C-methyl-D-erythritol kinase [Curvibacter sp. AEP1-3]ARV18505.1 4-diphosphocytidyl-2-C-methyl-D-erythritol kinase [Curvibacter sp. AEP1-3]
MQSLYDIPAPAKLNLFLHIVGRRDDGYHLLQSPFMLIDWCDTLHFSQRSNGKISREDLTWALPEDDLVVRAARALQQATGCTAGAHIAIHKTIPAQAGMGGGSSDAASTLLALNRLWNLRLSLEALSTIGLKLGADVPFFLGGRNAWVEGIGEKLTPVEIPVSRWIVVKPDAGLETKRIFSDPNLKRDSECATIYGFAAHTFDKTLSQTRNDLQAIAQTLCPEVNQALQWLDSKGLSGRMTGSGSAVFAHLNQDFNLDDVPSNFEVKLCSSLDVHPLQGWAPSDGLSVDSV